MSHVDKSLIVFVELSNFYGETLESVRERVALRYLDHFIATDPSVSIRPLFNSDPASDSCQKILLSTLQSKGNPLDDERETRRELILAFIDERRAQLQPPNLDWIFSRYNLSIKRLNPNSQAETLNLQQQQQQQYQFEEQPQPNLNELPQPEIELQSQPNLHEQSQFECQSQLQFQNQAQIETQPELQFEERPQFEHQSQFRNQAQIETQPELQFEEGAQLETQSNEKEYCMNCTRRFKVGGSGLCYCPFCIYLAFHKELGQIRKNAINFLGIDTFEKLMFLKHSEPENDAGATPPSLKVQVSDVQRKGKEKMPDFEIPFRTCPTMEIVGTSKGKGILVDNENEKDCQAVSNREKDKNKQVASFKDIQVVDNSVGRYSFRKRVAIEDEGSSNSRAKKKSCSKELTHVRGRNKLAFSKEEEEKIEEGVAKYCDKERIPWKDILESGHLVFGKTRKPMDLKDKYRNLLKKKKHIDYNK